VTKNGDLWKWIDAGVVHVTGADISKAHVDEGKRRFDEVCQSGKQKRLQAVDVALVDLCHPEFEKMAAAQWKVPVKEASYDLVECNFGLHYAFGTRETLVRLLTFASKCLKPGAFFIGTCVDGDALVSMAPETDTKLDVALSMEAAWGKVRTCPHRLVCLDIP